MLGSEPARADGAEQPRGVLTASAELSHLPEVSADTFNRYLWDVGLNVTVIMALILAVFLVRKRPEGTGAPPVHVHIQQ